MRQPEIYMAKELKNWPNSEEVQPPAILTGFPSYWRPARPVANNVRRLGHRWLAAWRVFTGVYDAVRRG